MRDPLHHHRLLAITLLLLAAPLAAQAPAPAAAAPPAPATAAAAPAPPASGTPGGDPKAAAIADAALAAMGGQAAWDGTHFLRFTFVARRTHYWDRWTGRHRLEGTTKEKESYVVLDNITTHQGTAYIDGKPVEGEKGKKLVENSYGAWVNDTYWLIMPYKLQDPGVNLTYAGEETVEGKVYDKLGLSFGKVGLTPGDHYTAYFNRDTHLMDRWAFILESMPKEGPPSVWKWEGWQKYGNIMLAPHRSQVGGDKKLELGDISVPAQLADAVFTSPAPVK